MSTIAHNYGLNFDADTGNWVSTTGDALYFPGKVVEDAPAAAGLAAIDGTRYAVRKSNNAQGTLYAVSSSDDHIVAALVVDSAQKARWCVPAGATEGKVRYCAKDGSAPSPDRAALLAQIEADLDDMPLG